MPEKRPRSSEAEERLDGLFAEYLEAAQRGELIDSREFAARHLDLAGALAAHERLGRLVVPLRGLATTVDCEPDETEALPAGTVIGDYEVLEVIGRGGMGIVYKARNREFNMVVALKMISAGPRPTEDQRRRFFAEVENQAKLNHPNIVSVTGGGEYEGRLYFTMKLIDGGDLSKSMSSGPRPMREIASILQKIARAVHHAHQRRVLHRDLKPSNVLLDSEGEPHVADFGLSKLIADDERTDSDYIVGAPAFVPPEQIDGQSTVLSDVYGLGTILYWMLTGQRPFEAETLQQTLRKVREVKPEPPHARNPQLNHWQNRYLEMICLKCLAKGPDQRYPSADALAVDLQHWLDHKPPLGVPVRPMNRLRSLCLRHPAAISLTVTAVVLLVFVTVAAVTAARHGEDALVKEFQRSNRFAAQHAANTVQLRLSEWGAIVLDSTRDLESRGLLSQDIQQDELEEGEMRTRLKNSNHAEQLQSFCRTWYGDATRRFPGVFNSWYVFNSKGIIIALWPPKDEETIGRSYKGREYFQYHAKNSQSDVAHVSRVFQSENDKLFKYAISAAMFDDRGSFDGVVAASIDTGSTLGRHRVSDDRQMVVVIGRGDIEPARPGAPVLPYQYPILIHSAYEHGQDPVEFPNERLWFASPPESDDFHVDPIFDGRWLAAFAPVQNTEFRVVVQQSYDEAIPPVVNLARSQVVRLGAALSLGLLLTGAAVAHWIRRHRSVGTALLL